MTFLLLIFEEREKSNCGKLFVLYLFVSRRDGGSGHSCFCDNHQLYLENKNSFSGNFDGEAFTFPMPWLRCMVSTAAILSVLPSRVLDGIFSFPKTPMQSVPDMVFHSVSAPNLTNFWQSLNTSSYRMKILSMQNCKLSTGKESAEFVFDFHCLIPYLVHHWNKHLCVALANGLLDQMFHNISPYLPIFYENVWKEVWINSGNWNWKISFFFGQNNLKLCILIIISVLYELFEDPYIFCYQNPIQRTFAF